MNANQSSATPRCEYQPTIIETRLLIERLATQLKFLRHELKRSWPDFKKSPLVFAAHSARHLFCRVKKFVSTPKTLIAGTTAILAVTSMVLIAIFVKRTPLRVGATPEDSDKSSLEIVFLNPDPLPASGNDGRGTGIRLSKATGGGGDRDPLPPQFGKLPPPSLIPAAIPKTPPIYPQALPVAGINIDPAQWIDVAARVYGDPQSKSQVPSSGPGEDGGIGTGKGPGIGSGRGSGGPGCIATAWSNGSGEGGPGCTGTGWSAGPLSVSEVDQRARLLLKPEPQYTEEARRNQIEGTVMLRVVFSSAGEVNQIQAMRTLPFGLTERAIAAARQIKFLPAMKAGHPVSVRMQLEYNFHLY